MNSKQLIRMLSPKSKAQTCIGWLIRAARKHVFIYHDYVYYIAACPDGSVVAKVPNVAVSSKLLEEMLVWNKEGAAIDDVIIRLRQRTVPTGYAIHNWQPGKSKLRLLKKFH